MELKLERVIFYPMSTIGQLFVNDAYECDILEDKVRPDGIKVKGQTAIPYGKYRIVIDYSNRFKKMMLHLLDVENFEGIRIHAGNTHLDTEGCLITGKADTSIGTIIGGTSRPALERLFQRIERSLQRGEEVWIDIVKQGAS